MLHNSIMVRVASHRNKKKLVLHSDNCSGQNKNRFVIFYLLWRVMVGLDDEVILYFLILGHTKNVCVRSELGTGLQTEGRSIGF